MEISCHLCREFSTHHLTIFNTKSTHQKRHYISSGKSTTCFVKSRVNTYKNSEIETYIFLKSERKLRKINTKYKIVLSDYILPTVSKTIKVKRNISSRFNNYITYESDISSKKRNTSQIIDVLINSGVIPIVKLFFYKFDSII